MLFLNRFNGFGKSAGAVAAPVTADFWRINVTLNNEGAYTAVAITDIVFKDSGGTPISTAGGTAAASASAGANTAAKAFDAITTTNWASTTALPQWIEMQFTGNVTPFSVDITGNNSSPDQAVNAIKDFDLQWSTDGISYTTAQSYSGETAWGLAETRNFVIQT
tara:strand:- start:5016 stop:5507 length:492 start_codon:yes stop_codon:yes gene_type:complete